MKKPTSEASKALLEANTSGIAILMAIPTGTKRSLRESMK